MTGAVLALACAFPSLAAAAGPTCDPAVALDSVHSGASVHGALTCDDPIGTGLNYSIALGGDPAHGSAMLDGAGGVDYYADPTYAGPDGFTVEVDDNDGGSTTVDVSVQVVNAAPACHGLALDSIAPGGTAYGSADCTDGDGDFLTYAVGTPPKHGSASVGSGFIQYTPDDGFSGSDTFTYTASDGIATSAPATVTVDVVNHAPTCQDDTLELRADKPATSYAFCSDEDYQSLTGSVVDAPAHGSVTFGAPGIGSLQYTYTPNAGFTGTDHFTFRAGDGTANSAPARIDITVTPDHAPECSTQPTHTGVGQAVQIYLSCYDSDTQDYDDVTYSLSPPSPAHGTISGFQQNAGYATLTYTPANGYVGADSFGFTASDGMLSATATQVMHVSDHPFCDPLAPKQVRPGRSFTVNLSCTQPSSSFDSLTYSLAAAPTKGTATVQSFGSVTYTANAGPGGADSFSIKANSPSTGDSNTVAQQITVTPDANTAPECPDTTPAPAYSGRKMFYLPFCLDADNDPLVYATNGTPSHGTSSIQAGSLVYTPDAGYTGPDTVPFTVTDGRVVVPGTLDMEVHAPEAPTCQAVPSFAVRPGKAHSFFLDCSDPQNDDETFSVVQQGAKGTVAFDANDFGSGTYSANPGASGTDSFQVRASNPVGPGNTITVQVTNIAESVNEAPDCSFTPARAVATGVATSLTPVCSDPDNDPLTFTRVSQPSHGTLTAGPASSLTYTSTPGYLGSDSFTYTATDDHGGTSTVATFLVNVVQSVAPTCTPLPDVTLRPGAVKSVTLNCADPNNQQISYSIVSGPAKGTLSPSGTSTNPTRSYAANSNATGDDSFTYQATSAGGTSPTYTQTFHLSSAANDPPQCFDNSAFPDEVSGGHANTLSGLCYDTDNDPLTYAIVSPPSHGTVALVNGTPVYTATSGYTGPDSFTYTASDGRVTTPTHTEYLQVLAPVPPSCPSFPAVDVRTNATGHQIRTSCDGGDFDTVTYVLDVPPTHGTVTQPFGNGFGAWSYTPASGFTGDDSFKWHAEDSDGSSPQQTQVIHVSNGANTAPSCASPVSLTAKPGVAKPLSAPCVDDDGDTLTGTLTTAPTHGTVVLPTSTTAGSYTATSGYTGPDTFTVSVSDGHGGTSSVTVNVTVSNANTPPSCVDLPITVAAGTTYTFDSVAPCSDADDDPVRFVAVTLPQHGTLGTNPDGVPTYTPTPGFSGFDSFTYQGNDGTASSAVRTVSITVTGPSGPTCSDLTKTVRNDQTLDVTLSCSPNGGGAITGYEIVTGPPASAGTLGTINQGTGVVRFTPKAGFTGPTSFTYRAIRGTETSAPATVSITVTEPPNQAPTASISGAGTVLRNAAITLTAVDGDADGTVVSRAWDIDGDGFDDGTGTSISPTFSTLGDHTVRLQVTDDDGASTIATKTITVRDNPPTASIAGPDQAFRGEPVALTGTDGDVDGTVTGRAWDIDGDGFDDGTGTSISPTFTTLGAKTIRYRVTDDDGVSTTATKTVTIVNRPPVAGTLSGPATALRGVPVALTAAPTDPDGAATIAKREWDVDGDGFDDGTGATLDHAFTTLGDVTVRFRVTDDAGATDIASKTITVANRPPAASIGGPAQVVRGQAVTLTDTSTDPDGHIASRAWTVDGAAAGTGASISPTFATLGTRTVTLKVTDDDGATATATKTLTVVEPSPPPPPPGGGGGGTGGGGGGTGGGGGGTADVTPPHGSLATAGAQKLAKALGKGLRLTLTTDEPCQIKVIATVDKKTAKQLKLGKKAVTVATGTASAGNGTATVTLKFTSKARKALKKAKQVKLKLVATAADAAGNTGTWTKTVTLKR